MPGTFRDKLSAPGPKKLLALDGGGLRGLIALEFLARIEGALRKKYGRDDLVLADYFDYIAGTSTGAIIGSSLAYGMSVAQIQEFYLTAGKEMFAPASIFQIFKNRYVAAKLSAELERVSHGITLGSDSLRTLLLLVMRNATTDSPWPISNNPNAVFNDPNRSDCNLKIPLWQLVRASAAAPVYFPPEIIDVGDQRFIFVDGGVTMYNNPAFLLFMMATLEPYKLCWPVGEDKLLLVSVGTGLSRRVNANLKAAQMTLLYNAASVPAALIYSSQVEQDKLCRIFGRVRFGREMDSEIGDLAQAGAFISPKLFSYVRYNVSLSRAELDDFGLTGVAEKDVQTMDRVDKMGDLQQLGAAAADRFFDIQHLAGFL